MGAHRATAERALRDYLAVVGRDAVDAVADVVTATATTALAPAGARASSPYDLLPPPAKRLGDLPLRSTVPVRIGGVEKRDAMIVECAAKHRHGFGVTLLAPPAGRDGPRPESDLAGGDRCAGESTMLHAGCWLLVAG